MSLLHSFLHRSMRKARVFYDPKQPKDYAAIRAQEVALTARMKLPRGMMHTWLVIPFFPESKRDLKRLGQDLNAAFAGTLTGADEVVWVDAPRGRRVRVRVGH